MHHKPAAPASQRGIALLMTVIIAGLVVALAMVIILRQSSMRRSVDNYESMETAWQYVHAMEQFSCVALQAGLQRKAYVYLPELGVTTDKTYPLLDASAQAITMRGHIEDLQGRFNLNNVVQDDKPQSDALEMLNRLAQAFQLPDQFAETVADWIDKNDDLLTVGGAESNYYTNQTIPYLAANAPFADVSEVRLLRLEGLTPAEKAKRLAGFLPVVTALPTTTKVNINSADATLLNTMGVPANQLHLPYKSMKDVQTAFPSLPTTVLNQLDVTSQYFLLVGEVHVGHARVWVNSVLARHADKSVTVVMRQFDKAITRTSQHANSTFTPSP